MYKVHNPYLQLVLKKDKFLDIENVLTFRVKLFSCEIKEHYLFITLVERVI